MAGVRKGHDIEPVAADLRTLADRQIAGGDLDVRVGFSRFGEQGALEFQGDAVLTRVAAGVVEVDGGPDRELLGDHHVLLGEGR